MTNRHFPARALEVLLRIDTWRLVCPAVADHRPVDLPRHRRWMSSHRHAHAYPEVMIALEGNSVYGIDGHIYPCKPGSVFVFGPGVLHDEGYPPWMPTVMHLWIAFVQGSPLARLVTAHESQQSHTQGQLDCPLELPDPSLWRESTLTTPSPPLPPELTRLRLLAAIAALVAALVEAGYQETPDPHRHDFQRDKIEAIRRHIRETGGIDASLDHLAQLAGYSRFHFLRLFRRYTGQSVHEYVNQARLRQVEALLAEGLALKAIAVKLGFSCPAAFSRWYRPFRERAATQPLARHI